MSLSSIHHSFDIQLATEFSVEEAILIHHFQHWIRINRDLKKNYHDNRTWSYQSQEWIAAHFPYLNKFQVQKLIKKLVKKSVLIVGNYNQKKYDRTYWYAFVNEEKYLPPIDKMLNSIMEDAKQQHGRCELASPIPDTITYTLTDAKESSLKRAKEAASPPPLESVYNENFENKIKISPANFIRLVEKFKDPDLINEYAEKLYRWSFNNELAFKKKKRHDMVIEDWIEKDRKEKKQNPNNFDKELNDAQLKNWQANKSLVILFKTDFHHKASGLNFYYKAHILKDKNDDNFSVSGLIDPRDFERVLAKHLRIKIHEQI